MKNENNPLPPDKISVETKGGMSLHECKAHAIEFAKWIAQYESANGCGYVDSLIPVDGVWFWKNDTAGDQPLSEEQLYEWFSETPASQQCKGEGWMSCAERKPDLGAEVYLTWDGYDLVVCLWSNEQWWVYSYECKTHSQHYNVLFWQPLPPPPSTNSKQDEVQ